jgi:hypothetical protein
MARLIRVDGEVIPFEDGTPDSVIARVLSNRPQPDLSAQDTSQPNPLAGGIGAATQVIGGLRGVGLGLGGAGAIYGGARLLRGMRGKGAPARIPAATPIPAPPTVAPAAAIRPSASLHVLSEADIAKFPQFANAEPGQAIGRKLYESVAFPEVAPPVRAAAKAAGSVPVRAGAAKVLPMRPSMPAEAQLAAVGSGAPEAVTQAVEVPKPKLSIVKKAATKAVKAGEKAAEAAAKAAPVVDESADAMKAAREAVLAAAHPTDNPAMNAAAKKAVIEAVGQEGWDAARKSAAQAAVGAASRFPGNKVAVQAAARASWYTALKGLKILDRVLNIVSLPFSEEQLGPVMERVYRDLGKTPPGGTTI